MKSFLLIILIFPLIILGQNHILITEIVVTPTAGEFVEIYNATGSTIDLSDYYLTDATYATSGVYYYNIVTGANAGGSNLGDFHARFPVGSTIASGEFQTIAMNGTGFVSTYGTQPTYELLDTETAIPDMLEAFTGSINGQGGLTNTGEMLILYYWDGQSDLVQDIDYVVWGDKVEAVDKTGISIDGPDPDAITSTYLNDTATTSQISVSTADPHIIGESIQRINLIENSETQSGGNGISGHDETSEDLATSFQVGSPNPGTGVFTPIDEKPGDDNINLMRFELSQNYPNPFNPSTTIKFTLPKSEFTTLKVFNILGKEVVTLVSNNLNQGIHTYQFDGKNLASGVYYYQLIAGDFTEIKKMVFIK